MRTLALVFFFIAIPVASGNWQPTDDASYWKGTGIDLPYAETFLSNEICYTDEPLFKSCVEAFAQAGAMLKTSEFRFMESARFDAHERLDFSGGLKRIDSLAGTATYPREMIWAEMINAQLRMFDGHALISPADKLNAKLGSISEDYTGIGVDESISAAGVHIRRVYPNTPAESAGLIANDRIVSIDGRPVVGGLQAVGGLKGLAKKPGTPVHIEIERGGQVFSAVVNIGNLNVRNVTVEYLPTAKNESVAIVAIRQFALGVCEEMESKLEFAAGKVSGMVLDLRNNPGGALDEAACVMSLFTGPADLVYKKPVKRMLPAKLPLVTDFSAEDQELWRTRMKPVRFPKMPLTVLVDAVSMSAAEMLAAALQDLNRAWVIGERTFGKGSTQAAIGEPCNGKLRLIYTVSRYYRKGGLPLQLIGMRPNFTVPVTKAATAAERIFPREGEFFGTLLGKEQAEPWKETREKEKKRILRALAKQSRVDRMNEWLTRKQGFEDFQKAYALAVLSETKDLKP